MLLRVLRWERAVIDTIAMNRGDRHLDRTVIFTTDKVVCEGNIGVEVEVEVS